MDIKFPVLNTKLVSIEKIVPNDYNPNSVAPPEMKLLKLSIEEDGYTQPVVCCYDSRNDLYHIVDGEHRYRCAKEYFKLSEVPVTIILEDTSSMTDAEFKAHLRAATIRHNRARGVHGIEPMIELVADILKSGWSKEKISKHLGMDADEVLRLTQAKGLPELFKDREFSKSWE